MDTNYVDMNAKSNENEHEIIILDDDDFIQTTFNIFSSSSSTPSRSTNQKESADVKNENLYQIDNLNTSNQQNSILIDLTTCDDFDLNDLLLMHSNNQINFNQNHQTSSSSSISNINNQCPEMMEDTKKLIKNELDFKIFNFNFGTSIEEILVDDDDEENEDEELEDEESASDRVNNQKHSTNLNMPSNLPNDCLQSASFVMYRTNDSSSETSSIKQSKKTIYKCEICFKTFNKSYNYKRHLFLQHESKSGNSFSANECPNCKKRILDRSNFNKHVRLCNQKTMKNKFKNSSNISACLENINHASNNSLSQQQITKKPLSNKHICEICNKQFNKKFNFHRHIRMHFLNEIMNHQHDPLNYSNRASPNMFKYNNTTTANNNFISNNNNLFEFFECEKCQRKFNEHKQLIQHKNKWHLTEYECKYCDEKFLEKFDYIKHLNSIHSNVKFKFECNYCKKSFKYLSQYMQHRRTHLLNNISMINNNNGRINFTNEEMDVEISSAKNDITSDENNLIINDDDKLIACEYCGRKFAKNFNLKRHIENKHNKIKTINDESENITNLNSIGDQTKNEEINNEENNGINKIDARNVFDCNLNQKQMYKNCKINHHLNRVNLN